MFLGRKSAIARYKTFIRWLSECGASEYDKTEISDRYLGKNKNEDL